MSYKVTFRNKTSTILDPVRGENLKQLLLSNKPPANIDINGNMYRSSEIVTIEHYAEAGAQPVSDSPQLPAGPTCHGEFSIQRRITELIKQKYPRDWPKHIGNTRERELIRHRVRKAETGPWCDARAGECACDTAQLTMASTSV